MTNELHYKGRLVHLMCATHAPMFGSAEVVSTDIWEYVSLWLRRGRESAHEEALFYWSQARDFYEASMKLPESSSPLTSYYFALNATKALLALKGVNAADEHGVNGGKSGDTSDLANEKVMFKRRGVLPALSRFLGAVVADQDVEFTLKKLFRLMPFVHRSYTLTYKSEQSLFIPLTATYFRRPEGRSSYFFHMRPAPHYDTEGLEDVLPAGFELCPGRVGEREVRRKAKIEWGEGGKVGLERLINHHQKIRQFVLPISGRVERWYLRKGLADMEASFRFSQLVLMFGAFHRLSEIVRYEPSRLKQHFEQEHNWLLLEFIRIAPLQFLLQIAAEMTGSEFCVLSMDESIHRSIGG